MRVIGIGDNVCDKYEHLRLMFPGGQAANFAVYAGMLGAESAYMGVFGRDEVAEHVIATLDELQVGTWRMGSRVKHLIICTRPIIAILTNSFLNWQNRESLYRMIFRVSGSMKNE